MCVVSALRQDVIKSYIQSALPRNLFPLEHYQEVMFSCVSITFQLTFFSVCCSHYISMACSQAETSLFKYFPSEVLAVLIQFLPLLSQSFKGLSHLFSECSLHAMLSCLSRGLTLHMSESEIIPSSPVFSHWIFGAFFYSMGADISYFKIGNERAGSKNFCTLTFLSVVLIMKRSFAFPATHHFFFFFNIQLLDWDDLKVKANHIDSKHKSTDGSGLARHELVQTNDRTKQKPLNS